MKKRKEFIPRVFGNHHLRALAALACLTTAVFWGQFSGVSLATFQDNTYMYLPVLAHASKVFARGEFPYWINTIAGGVPLFDSPQLTIDYPFYLLRLNLYSSALDASMVVHYLTLFHYVILLVNSYILMRTLGASVGPAIFGAGMFAFSPNLLGYSFAITLVAPYSWLPLFLAALLQTFFRERFAPSFFLGVFSMVMLVLAAPSLPFIHCLFVAAVLMVGHITPLLLKKHYALCFRSVTRVAAIGATSFVIVSPYLVSEFLSLPGFIRWIGEHPPVIGRAKIPFEGFLVGQLSPENFLDFVAPHKAVHIIGNGFIGGGALFLALLSFSRRAELPLFGAFVFLTVWGGLSAFGSHFGLAYVNYHVPFLNLMREPGRHLFLFVFGASVLATSGLQYLVSNSQNSAGFFLTKRNVVSFAAVVGILLFRVSKFHEDPFYWSLTAVYFLALLSYLAFSKARRGAVAVCALSILAGNIHTFPVPRIPLSDGDYFTEWNLRAHRILQDLAEQPDIKDYRAIFDTGPQGQYWSMIGSYYGIRSLSAYFNPLPYQQFAEVFYQGAMRPNYGELLGVKYYLCSECDPSKAQNLTFVREILGVKLFQSERAFPRYRVLHQLGNSYSNEDEFFRMLEANTQYLETLLVSSADLPHLKEYLHGDIANPCVVQEEVSSPNKLSLSIECGRPGILVFNEYASPNWRAEIRSSSTVQPAQLFAVNLNQIGLPVKDGRSIVTFEYRPRMFYWLRILSITLVSCLILGFFAIFTRQKGGRDHGIRR